jgi:hypothetical protein
VGKFHDQADAEWIVIRGSLRGHNDMPFGLPTPVRPIGRPGVGHPQGVFGVFSYYYLVMPFLSVVCLTVALFFQGVLKTHLYTCTGRPPIASAEEQDHYATG